MRILNDHNGNIDGSVILSCWDADLIAEALVSLIGDIPEEHPDLDVAARLHNQMLSLFDALEKDELRGN
jgi:hypothetical protein